jgi:hypothetical protein
MLSVLSKFAQQPCRLGDLKEQYFSTVMWDETGAQKKGITCRSTSFPKDSGYWILSGPHFYVGTPFYKSPRRVCLNHHDYDHIDLRIIPDAYVPRTNYIPACDPLTYHKRTPKVPWSERPVTAFHRIFFRRQLSQSGERTLTPMIAPPKVGHIHPVNSLSLCSRAFGHRQIIFLNRRIVVDQRG